MKKCIQRISSMKFATRLLAIVLCMALLSTALFGTGIITSATSEHTVYVSVNDGDDTNGDGTQAKPFKTIKKAMSHLIGIQGITAGTVYLDGAHADTNSDGYADEYYVYTRQDNNAKHNFPIKITSEPNTGTAKVKSQSYSRATGDLTFENLELTRTFEIHTFGNKVTIKNCKRIKGADSETNGEIRLGDSYAPALFTTSQTMILEDFAGNNNYLNPLLRIGGVKGGNYQGVNLVIGSGVKVASFSFYAATFNADVNITINGGNQAKIHNGTSASTISLLNDLPTFKGALQFVFNNNTGASDFAPSDAVKALEAVGGTWFIYGKDSNGSFETTSTPGTFKVNLNTGYIAEITKTGETEVIETVTTNGSTVTLDAGSYDVNYINAASQPYDSNAYYVSVNGDDSFNGSENYPFATVAKAFNTIVNNSSLESGTIYLDGSVEDAIYNLDTARSDSATFKHSIPVTITSKPGTTAKLKATNFRAKGETIITNVELQADFNININGRKFVLSDVTWASGIISKTIFMGDAYLNDGATNTLVLEKDVYKLDESGNYNGGVLVRLGNGKDKTFGGIDMTVGENVYLNSVQFMQNTFNGNVNITVNGGELKGEMGFDGGHNAPTITGAMQILLNNNTVTKFHITDKVKTDINPAKGKWFVYSDDTDGYSLKLTETPGKFEVVGGSDKVAVAYKVGDKTADDYNTRYLSDENGYLTLPQNGEYEVTYIDPEDFWNNKGDANEDFSIDIRDLVAISIMIEGNRATTPAADINGIDGVTVDDLTILRKHLLGIDVNEIAKPTESKLQNLAAAVQRQDQLDVGFIGGSVTYGAGVDTDREYLSWRAIVRRWLRDQFSEKVKVEEYDASVGATGSFHGSYRMSDDLPLSKLDVLFIEFAINDEYDALTEAQTKRNYESLIQQAYNANPNMQIIVLFTTDFDRRDQWETNSFARRNYQQAVADHYGIYWIDIGKEMWRVVKEDYGVNNPSSISDDVWRKYFTDVVHPTAAGYRVYADYIISQLNDELYNTNIFNQYNDYDLSYANKETLTAEDELKLYGKYLDFDEAGFDDIKGSYTGWELKNSQAGDTNFGTQTGALVSGSLNAHFGFKFKGNALAFFKTRGLTGVLEYKVYDPDNNNEFKFEGQIVLEYQNGAYSGSSEAFTATDLKAKGLTTSVDKEWLVVCKLVGGTGEFRYIYVNSDNTYDETNSPILPVADYPNKDNIVVVEDKFGYEYAIAENLAMTGHDNCETQRSTDFGGYYDVYEIGLNSKSFAPAAPALYNSMLPVGSTNVKTHSYMIVDYYYAHNESSNKNAFSTMTWSFYPHNSAQKIKDAYTTVTKNVNIVANKWSTAIIDLSADVEEFVHDDYYIRQFIFRPFGTAATNFDVNDKIYVKAVRFVDEITADTITQFECSNTDKFSMVTKFVDTDSNNKIVYVSPTGYIPNVAAKVCKNFKAAAEFLGEGGGTIKLYNDGKYNTLDVDNSIIFTPRDQSILSKITIESYDSNNRFNLVFTEKFTNAVTTNLGLTFKNINVVSALSKDDFEAKVGIIDSTASYQQQ